VSQVPPASPRVPPACLNCGEPLQPTASGAAPGHCPVCGQETRVRPATLGELLQQFGGAYFATEGALQRSLKLLLLKPGELTRQYLAGRRKHYVLPLRLYLTISVLTFLLLRLLAGVSMTLQLPSDLDLRQGLWTVTHMQSPINAGLNNGSFFCRGLPAWFCNRLETRLDTDPKGLRREVEALPGRFISNLGGAMFLMLPLFALLHKLAYWNRRLHYTEHLVFALHLHAFWFLCLLLTLLPFTWLSWLVALLVPAYALAALRRVYGGRWHWLCLRAGLVSIVYGLALAIGLVLLVFWSLLF
jgi:predicted RNA-binding Zn-ribbon protein involved in translation (DUF1610 family)